MRSRSTRVTIGVRAPDAVSKPSAKISDLLLTIHIPWQPCNLQPCVFPRASPRRDGVARVKNIALLLEYLTGRFYEDATVSPERPSWTILNFEIIPERIARSLPISAVGILKIVLLSVCISYFLFLSTRSSELTHLNAVLLLL